MFWFCKIICYVFVTVTLCTRACNFRKNLNDTQFEHVFGILKCLEALLLRMTCACIVIDLTLVCLGSYLPDWWFTCLRYVQFSRWIILKKKAISKEFYAKQVLTTLFQKNYFKCYFERILNNICFHNSFRKGFFSKRKKN